jgi:hypothetical protein
MKNKTVLKDLKAEHFIHPGDRELIAELKKYKKF